MRPALGRLLNRLALLSVLVLLAAACKKPSSDKPDDSGTTPKAAELPLLEVKARPGQKFIVAGQSYKRGILVLVFKVLR